MRPLLIIGAGGCGRETLVAARAANAASRSWTTIGFLDDDPDLQGAVIDGATVVGITDDLAAHPDAAVVVTIGNPGNYTTRRKVVTRLDLPDHRWATIVHPAAVIAPGTHIGPGSVVLAGTVTTSPVYIGAHAVVMPAVVLTHDDAVADYVSMGSGVRLAGGVTVEEGAYVGAGALVREQCTIGAWAQVAMGAAVITDVPAGEVWAGVPARRLPRRDGAPE